MEVSNEMPEQTTGSEKFEPMESINSDDASSADEGPENGIANGRAGDKADVRVVENPALRKLRFQLYRPRSDVLQKYFEEVPEPESFLAKAEEELKSQIDESNRRFDDPALDLDNLIPKPSDYDIKRYLKPKFLQLEEKTRRAILEINKKKAKESQEDQDNDVDGAESISSAE